MVESQQMRNLREAAAKTALRKSGWLSEEADWMKDAILANAHLRQYMPGGFTHYAGDDVGGMFGIAEGSFGVLISSAKGELTLCHVLRPGWWFGIGPILTKGPRLLSYRALEPSQVLHVSLSDLNSIGTRFPEFFRRIGILSESSFHDVALQVVRDLLITSGERRIAAVLARVAAGGKYGMPGPPAPVCLSQSEIGEMSNSSRDRVNRALRKFAKAGWITLQYRSIDVHDLNALTEFSQG